MILDLAFLADLPLTFSEVSSEKNTPVFIEMDPKKWLVFFVAQVRQGRFDVVVLDMASQNRQILRTIMMKSHFPTFHLKKARKFGILFISHILWLVVDF